MIALLIEFALFFLTLFFVMPALLIFLMIVRELLRQHRKHMDAPRTLRRRDIAELPG